MQRFSRNKLNNFSLRTRLRWWRRCVVAICCYWRRLVLWGAKENVPSPWNCEAEEVSMFPPCSTALYSASTLMAMLIMFWCVRQNCNWFVSQSHSQMWQIKMHFKITLIQWWEDANLTWGVMEYIFFCYSCRGKYVIWLHILLVKKERKKRGSLMAVLFYNEEWYAVAMHKHPHDDSSRVPHNITLVLSNHSVISSLYLNMFGIKVIQK